MLRNLKGFLVGAFPIVIIFGLGLLAWRYYTGTLNIESDVYSAWLEEYVAGDPYWYSRYRPEADNPSLLFRQRLPDYRLSAAKARLDRLATLQAQLAEYAPRKEDTLDHALLQHWTAQELAGRPWLLHHFPLDPIDGQHLQLEDLLVSYHLILAPGDAEAYLKRLSLLPRACRQWEELILTQAEAGLLPPAEVLRATNRQLTRYAELPFDQHPLYVSFARRAQQADMTQLNEYQILDYLERIAASLETKLQPAFRGLARTCDSLAQTVAEHPYALDPEYYAYLLTRYTGDTLAVADLHQQALDRLAYWSAELQRYHDSPGVTAIGPLPDYLQATGPEAPVDSLQKTYLENWLLLRRDLGRYAQGVMDSIPIARLLTRPTLPGRMRPGYLHYLPAALDGRARAARLELDLNRLEHWTAPRQELMVTTWQMPGQHLLWTRHLRAGQRSDFRRFLAHPTVVQGWQIYAPYLLDHDLAAWYHRPPIRLLYLHAQLRYALCLAVDTGLHGQGWTRVEAKTFLRTRGYLTEEQVEAHMLHVLARPGEIAAAVVGFEQLKELRQRMQQILGDDFYVQAFHNALLYAGALPPHLLAPEVQRLMVEKSTN